MSATANDTAVGVDPIDGNPSEVPDHRLSGWHEFAHGPRADLVCDQCLYEEQATYLGLLLVARLISDNNTVALDLSESYDRHQLQGAAALLAQHRKPALAPGGALACHALADAVERDVVRYVHDPHLPPTTSPQPTTDEASPR